MNKKNVLLCGVVGLIVMAWVTTVSADMVIVKGLYQSPSEWGLTLPGSGYGCHFKETQWYALDQATGIGVAYEYGKRGQGFRADLGLEYYFDRNVPEVKYHGYVSDGPFGQLTYSGKKTLDDVSIQTTYITASGKYYFTNSFFFGAIVKRPSIKLKGDQWGSDTRIEPDLSLGAITGVEVGNFIAELYCGTDKLVLMTTDPDGNKVKDTIVQSVAQVSVGYIFSLKEEVAAPSQNAEINNDDTKNTAKDRGDHSVTRDSKER